MLLLINRYIKTEGKKEGKHRFHITTMIKILTGMFLFILILKAFIMDTETGRIKSPHPVISLASFFFFFNEVYKLRVACLNDF